MDREPDRPPEVGEPIRPMPDDLAPALSEIELVADIWAADAREARYVAERAVSVAHFARRRRRQRIDERGPRGGPGLDSRHRQLVELADYSVAANFTAGNFTIFGKFTGTDASGSDKITTDLNNNEPRFLIGVTTTFPWGD